VGVTVLVFGHRGACGYLPENTMESFELAFAQGADAIEFDVVITKDGYPVIRHDRDLTMTTNISSKSFLSNNVDELNLSDLDQLRAIERYPEGRVESDLRSGEFRIPTLAQVLANPAFDQKHLIVEIKYGEPFMEVGLDVVQATATAISESDFQQRGIQLTIECFEFGVLKRAKQLIGPVAKYVFLSAPDMLPAGDSEITDEYLSQIAAEFDGLSVAIPMVLQSDLVSRTKARSMPIYIYTARTETAEGDVSGWFERLIATGVDGIFADQPDVLRKVRDAL
jgi:glycerophosphoryl diester phosphodiesterase